MSQVQINAAQSIPLARSLDSQNDTIIPPLDALTGIRFIAAGLVYFHHLQLVIPFRTYLPE